ncbi:MULTISPECIES: AbiJ-NTD4 domain-containing protein [Brenneria]|uniref:HEPN AbiJ-N-terminal domain-containing protein n=1 Tax=Brenneria nigrifluens DSM 30175 = ATCC 13028 TaxID=1121120 RepID=A0A2U1UWD9_9GAMM|nr:MULTISPECIES: hypothetical protein [Brenneria]EHD22657.1 putative phage-related protein [Brenneria sp. EniD312]PWC25977.1 hypothetical protein DDT54_01230 [Brenneria nigrifluens DSM 30175 = ATCC 13028]QCR05639.1 hypothetical protein EH206_16490 [Brenneria nigrifluens DSM 30175 = ATCC 13028]
MPSFSQRMGIRPMQKAIQRESMDNELRIGLWNVLQIAVWDKWSDGSFSREKLEITIKKIWIHFFKLPVDKIPAFHYDPYRSSKDAHEIIRDFFFEMEWWELYDFFEFTLQNIPDEWRASLSSSCNYVLEKENAAYRLIDEEIVEITDNLEIEAIEDAIGNSSQSAKSHLQRALELLSDRKQPDYRNSIKESISAVESVCNAISGDSKGTLGKGLKQIETAISLHPSLKSAFSNLYGYTCDSGGIRHAFIDGDITPSFADAKFMLVACSAFCNYLWTKVAENGR